VLAFSNIENYKLKVRAHDAAAKYAHVVASAIRDAMPSSIHPKSADAIAGAIAYGDPETLVQYVGSKMNASSRAFIKEHFIPRIETNAPDATWVRATLASLGYDTAYLVDRVAEKEKEKRDAQALRRFNKIKKLLDAVSERYRKSKDIVEFVSDNVDSLRQSDMDDFAIVFHFPQNRLTTAGNATDALDAMHLAYTCKRYQIPVNTRHVSMRHSEQYVVIAGVDVVVPPTLALFIDWLKTRP